MSPFNANGTKQYNYNSCAVAKANTTLGALVPAQHVVDNWWSTSCGDAARHNGPVAVRDRRAAGRVVTARSCCILISCTDVFGLPPSNDAPRPNVLQRGGNRKCVPTCRQPAVRPAASFRMRHALGLCSVNAKTRS